MKTPLRPRWQAPRSALAALALACASLLAACGGGDEGVRAAGERQRPLAAIDIERVSPTELMDWAAVAYSEYFKGPAIDGVSPPYVYRYFQGSGNYIGVDGSLVYVLGPPFSTQPLLVGRIGDFECSVRFAACVAPSFVTPPASREVVEGRSASFTPEIGGGPSLVYQWLRNDQPIAGATAATLNLPAVPLADQGARYSLKVSNAKGTQTSEAATLTVAARVDAGSLIALMARYGCSSCHTTSSLRINGPGFADVGAKYAPTADAISYIASRIRFGSSGVWGGSMPGQPGVSLADARAIAAGIVGLAP